MRTVSKLTNETQNVMSVQSLLINTGSEPGKIRLGIIGSIDAEKPFFTIHVNLLGDAREETVWCTALNTDQVGGYLENQIENISNGAMYCIYVGQEEFYSFNTSADPNKSIFKAYFRYENENVTILSEDDYLAKKSAMNEYSLSPIFAPDSGGAEAPAYEVVFFFAGVNIHHHSAMKGISIIPITPGMSNASIFNDLNLYFQERHSIILPTGPELIPHLRYQPMFSIDFHKIVAPTEHAAFKHATQLAHDICDIIASERGDRPFPVLSLILEYETLNWKIIPTGFDLRGNLLPPLFASTSMERVELLYPIIQAEPYARLTLELYVQALAERDRSFTFFRQWALLEMIADKRVTTSDATLLNLDNSEILLGSGKALTTQRKEGKVYSYLRNGQLSAIYQGTHSGQVRVLEGSAGGVDQGAGVVTLWEAVAATYSIRNEVAHDGRYDFAKVRKSDREKLARELFSGTFGFLEHAVEYAVWREIIQKS